MGVLPTGYSTDILVFVCMLKLVSFLHCPVPLRDGHFDGVAVWRTCLHLAVVQLELVCWTCQARAQYPAIAPPCAPARRALRRCGRVSARMCIGRLQLS